MRNTFKKVMVSVLAVALLLGVAAVPPQDAQAAGKDYMKGLKLNWDLKKNKAVKYTTSAEIFKKVSGKAKITNYKVKSAGKGCKQLSFNVTFGDDKIKISNAQWKELRRMNGRLKYGEYWISVADYDTGLSLERKNKFGVKVRFSRWKTINAHAYRNGNDTFYVDGSGVKIKITYPEDYDGLCIGVGGQNRIGETRADSSYWKGKTKFGQTSFYKTGKKNSHWMRIRASKKKPASTSKPKTKKTPVPTSSPSGGTPATSVPASTPSGNTPVTSVPTVEPSGDVPTTPVTTLTPSGNTPTTTISPDVSGLRTMVYDGTNSEEIKYAKEPIAVVVKDGLTEIGENAFYGSSLASITIPDSVTSIGEDAFCFCRNLTSITIPNSVTSICEGAFFCCSHLNTIQVSEGNTVYDSRNHCNALIETGTNTLIMGANHSSIPDSVTSIGDGAFQNCEGLTGIIIPSSVTSIGENAFNSCSSLTGITIPDSVTSIGDGAFYGCSSLTGITLSNGMTGIGNEMFEDCERLENITIPDSVTSIGNSAFRGCSSLTSITWKGTDYNSVDSFETAFGGFTND